MNTVVKLIIGVIIFFAGIYWYVAELFGQGFSMYGISTIKSLATVFFGLFGLLLIFVGFVVAWIEYEDIKWEREEKKAAKKK